MTKIMKWLYPPRCPVCDRVIRLKQEKHGIHCCPECENRLPWVGDDYCLKCGRPVPQEQEFCSDCASRERMFDQGKAAFLYKGKIRQAVYRMKVQNRRDLIQFFSDSMLACSFWQIAKWKPEEIIPVPMHPKKKRRRGYNQSELLARLISNKTGIPINLSRVSCTRIVSEQKSLNKKERRKNLRGCFQVTHADQMPGSVLVIDDIYTTGSTMDEMSEILKKNGVSRVFFLVICTVERI